MSTIPYASAHVDAQLPFTDRRGRLIAVGVISLIFAACAGCLTALLPVALLIPQAGGDRLPVADFVSALLIYLFVTTFFAFVGAGGVRSRRWVRPVMLPVAWTWLASGVVMGAFWIIVGPGVMDAIQSGANAGAGGGGAAGPGPAAVKSIAAVAIALTAVIAIVVPAIYIWLLAPQDVRRTADHFAPPAWTDGRPLPVLAVAIWLALAALGMLANLAYPVFSLFGIVLTGPAAVVGIVCFALVLGVLAVHVAQRRRWAWAASLGIVLFWAASTIVTAMLVHPLEVMRRAGHSEEEIAMMEKFQGMTPTTLIVTAALFAAAFVAYLMCTRRHFELDAPPRLPPTEASAAPVQTS